MDNRLKIRGNHAKETNKKREKWFLLGFYNILGNQIIIN